MTLINPAKNVFTLFAGVVTALFTVNVLAQSLSGGLGGLAGGQGGINSTVGTGGNGANGTNGGTSAKGGGGGGAGVIGGSGGNGGDGGAGTIVLGGLGGAGGASPGASGANGLGAVNGTGGGGGGGAAGLVASSSGTNSVSVSGGSGGAGGNGSYSMNGCCSYYAASGGGGAGAYGVIVSMNVTYSNAGTISGGAGGAGGVGFNSYQSGAGGSGGYGAYLGSGSTLINYGTISGGSGGGGIGDTGSSAPGVYVASGSNSIITNTGTITSGADEDSITNWGTNTFIINSLGGQILGAYNGISNNGTLSTITNRGTILGGENGIENYSTISLINNESSGLISGKGNAGIGQWSGTNIDAITNAGTIRGVNFGIFNLTTISTITNLGTITISDSSAYSAGIYNDNGTIGTLNNLQGRATNTPLTYGGNLPAIYNIIIRGSTSYGQLVSLGATGNTTFGISSLSAGLSVVSGTAYTSVLKGITNTQLGTSGTSIAGTSNNYTYTLSRSDAVNNIWDLIVSGFSGSGGSGGSGGGSSSSAYRSNALASFRNHAAGAAGMLDSLYTNTAMSGVMTALDGLSGIAQANAITQTLPVITGAASQATTGTMQALNQIVQGRSNSLRGMSSGDDYVGNRDVWMKGFGSWANQHDLNGVSGYKINTGGLAIGVDQGITPKMNIGAVLAFANSGVSSASGSAPSGVTINSYQAGLYGDYAIEKNIIANAQADIGMNQNKEYRNITFMGTNANGNYNSYSGHLGTGVKYLMPVDMENTFIPSVRVDYTTVQSQAYSESGAGALNLSVAKQTYNTLIPSADVRIDHSLDSKMTLSANAGAGYNTLNNQVSATSAYAGGGTTFVTNGLQVSPWLYNAGVGVTGQIDKNLQLNVRYDNVFSPTGYINQMVSAKLKIPL
jgi:uncharacterized protein with beta-barrel porin domain